MAKPLPRAIAGRITELPPHVRALRENAERITLDEYRRALTSRTTADVLVLARRDQGAAGTLPEDPDRAAIRGSA